MTRVVDLRKKSTETKEIEKSLPQKKGVSLVETRNIEDNASRPATGKLIKKTERIEWEAPSFYHNPQKRYLALVVIALLTGAGTVLFYRLDNLTAIFLILSSLVLILYANKKPTISRIMVSQAGVAIDSRTYYYKELKSFWLDYDPHGLRELSLESKKWYTPYIKVSIENQNPVEIRSLMVNFVAEKEHDKSLVDMVSRKLGL